MNACLPDVRDLFRKPEGIILYGASDGSQWSRSIFSCIRGYGYAGPMHAVNQRGVPAHGLQGFRSACEAPGPVDTAYVFVPGDAVPAALRDLARAGVRRAVVLSSGFAEVGPQGQARQDEIVRIAHELGITFLGPNSLGLANIAAGHAVAAMPPSRPLLPGQVAIVSQSGATCSDIADFAAQQGIGLSLTCAVGNEAMVDASAVALALAEDESTQAIALFVEAIRDPATFRRAAEAARQRRKPLVVLKVGASAAGAAAAQAHTGALVGDDRVFDAICRRHAVVRVDSIEDLVVTAGLLAHTGVLEKPGVALVSLSGGACGLVADYADALGIPMPALAPETVQELRRHLPEFAATLNPFDITGAAIRTPELFVPCLRAVGNDPGVGLTIAAYSVFSDAERLTPRLPIVQAIGTGLAALGARGILTSAAVRPLTGEGLQALRRAGIRGAFGGLAATMRAVKQALWWSKQVALPPVQTPQRPTGGEARSLPHERAVLDYLARHGVPVIPARVVHSAREAASAQQAFGEPVALKVLSPAIQHKTEVGGVRLGVSADAGEAYEALLANVGRNAPEAAIEGVTVSPMRSGGTELLVGIASDPQWGPVLTVALGGIFTELLRDSAVRPLPVDANEVLAMLDELRGARLLRGYRGAPAADLGALARAIAAIADAALALGPRLAVLEVNPLLAGAHGCEALDGLAVWHEDGEHGAEVPRA